MREAQVRWVDLGGTDIAYDVRDRRVSWTALRTADAREDPIRLHMVA